MQEFQSPWLFHKSKTGSVRVWSITSRNGVIITQAGTKEGKITTSTKEIQGKNVGRANETTAQEQAIKEARAKFQQKLANKYYLTEAEALNTLEVGAMLAHSYEKKKYTFPLHVQPKLDGIRCLAFVEDGELQLWTRGKKPITTCQHIKDALLDLYPIEQLENVMLDGELYIHGKTFQEVTKLYKKYREGESEQLVYHIYDVVKRDEPDTIWRDTRGLSNDFVWDRFTFLKGLNIEINRWREDKTGFSPIVAVSTNLILTEDDLNAHEEAFIQAGYEGLMIRLFEYPYLMGYRSAGLLKVKRFQDAEFPITSFQPGSGSFADCCIWTCTTNTGDGSATFNVAANGTLDEKRRALVDAPTLVGRMLKVKFFEYTDDGIPRFPVALGIREEADMDPQLVEA